MKTKMKQVSGYLIALGCGNSEHSQEEANRSALKAAGVAHLNISAEISIPGVLPKNIPVIDPQTISPGTVVLCLYVHLDKNEEFKCVGVATAEAANSNLLVNYNLKLTVAGSIRRIYAH